MELEQNTDLRSQIKYLKISAVKEVPCTSEGKTAMVVFVPPPSLKKWQKIQTRVVRELEKKLAGRQVFFVAQRKILNKPTRKSRVKNMQKRPRSRTLTTVHEKILEDLVYPSEICGKRTKVSLDGSRLMRVFLDKSSQTQVEHKVGTFTSVYEHLTGNNSAFQFQDA